MMSLASVFWLFVIVFAVIGAMRGWSKELLVTFSIIISLFILGVLEKYVPPAQNFLSSPDVKSVFWTRSIIVIVLVFFGYSTPNIQKFGSARFARERLSDTMLGLVLGALNGFLLVGTLWYFLELSNYPYPDFISAPNPTQPLGASAMRLLPYLAPRWLGVPMVYFAVALFALFVLVVFI
jgi:uncharacterized membrane protein required for colicin V production